MHLHSSGEAQCQLTERTQFMKGDLVIIQWLSICVCANEDHTHEQEKDVFAPNIFFCK